MVALTRVFLYPRCAISVLAISSASSNSADSAATDDSTDSVDDFAHSDDSAVVCGYGVFGGEEEEDDDEGGLGKKKASLGSLFCSLYLLFLGVPFFVSDSITPRVMESV